MEKCVQDFDEVLQSSKRTKIPSPLEYYMTKSEFNRISDHLLKPIRIRKAVENEIEKYNTKKQLTKDMIKNWTRTVQQVVAEQSRGLGNTREQREQEKNKLFEESAEQNEKERHLFIEKVKKSLYLKEGYPLTLTYAMKCGEVESAWKKQIEFKNMMKQHDVIVEQQYAIKVKEAAQEEVREKQEEERKRREAAIASKKLCYQQYLDQKAAEKLEKEERHKNEQEDNMKNVEEMEILEQEELKKAAEYKRNLKKSCSDFFALQKSCKEKLLIEDKDQELAMKLYNEKKHTIECIRKEKELQKIKDRFDKAEKFGLQNEAERKALEDKENEIIAKATKERDEIEEQKRLNELEKIRKYKEDLQKQREEHLIQEANRKRYDNEMLKWNMLNRNKQNDVIQQELKNEKAKRWKNVLKYKETLIEQMNELSEKQREENTFDSTLSQVTSSKYKDVDNEFLKYADDVKQTCNSNKWSTFAVNKVIKSYKKENNLKLESITKSGCTS